MVRDAYGDSFDDVAPATAGSGVSSFVEDDDDRKLGDILLSRNADLFASLCVEFTAIHTGSCEFSFAVPYKAKDVFALVLQCLDALKESREANVRIMELEASGAQELAKQDALESHELELFDENQVLSINWSWLLLKKSVMRLGTWRSRKLSPTLRLSSQMRKMPLVCAKDELLGIGRQCVAPCRVETAWKANWRQRRRSSKWRMGAYFPASPP